MPRVKLAGYQYKDKDLQALIRRYKYGAGQKHTEAGAAIGVSDATWRRWMKQPGKIPLDKLRAIQKALGVPKEEMYAFLL